MVIIKRSPIARLVTSKLVGDLRDLTLDIKYSTIQLPVIEMNPREIMATPRSECHNGFMGGNLYQWSGTM